MVKRAFTGYSVTSLRLLRMSRTIAIVHWRSLKPVSEVVSFFAIFPSMFSRIVFAILSNYFQPYRLFPVIFVQFSRKQCENNRCELRGILTFRLMVHQFTKYLCISQISNKENFIKLYSLRHIIWRSQVQALAGPQWKSATYEYCRSLFFVSA